MYEVHVCAELQALTYNFIAGNEVIICAHLRPRCTDSCTENDAGSTAQQESLLSCAVLDCTSNADDNLHWSE